MIRIKNLNLTGNDQENKFQEIEIGIFQDIKIIFL